MRGPAIAGLVRTAAALAIASAAALAIASAAALAIASAASLAIASAASAQTVTTVAGTGAGGYTGNGGPATSAELQLPTAVAPTPDGGYLIADWRNSVIREVSASGTITTVAGNSSYGFSGDGGPATSAQLAEPNAVVPTADGGFLIADEFNNRIRKVDYGTITTVAGSGTPGHSGDGGPATGAELDSPMSIALTSDGGFLIADYENNRIRKVSAGGTITTVAGTGTSGFSGDGGPATAAEINHPSWVASTSDGGFLIADFGNQRIREVSAGGTITTVAGNGTTGFSGDGGPATAAELHDPTSVEPTANGGFLIADRNNNRVREVSAAGTITTVAGNGTYGYSGDGGPATSAEFELPADAAPTSDGGFLIADENSNRIRKVSAPPTPPATPVISGLSVSPHKSTITGRRVHGKCVERTHKNRKKKHCKQRISLQIKYTLNTAAAVTIKFAGQASGRKVKGSCVKRTHKNRKKMHCTRKRNAPKTTSHVSAAGSNTFTYTHKALKSGDYTLTLTPAGGTPQTATFKVVS